MQTQKYKLQTSTCSSLIAERVFRCIKAKAQPDHEGNGLEIQLMKNRVHLHSDFNRVQVYDAVDIRTNCQMRPNSRILAIGRSSQDGLAQSQEPVLRQLVCSWMNVIISYFKEITKGTLWPWFKRDFVQWSSTKTGFVCRPLS